jgi:HK97 gp10 family phage protein
MVADHGDGGSWLMAITGYKELSRQLSAMGAAAGGQALKSAAFASMRPAVEAAQAAAPKAQPPYGPYKTRSQPLDPYPKKTYKGRRVAPGFTSRSVAVKAYLRRTRDFVKVALGVRREAFYALAFIELGTSKIPKRPWLEPAFRGAVSQVDELLQERLRRLIDRAAKRGRVVDSQ